MLDPITGNVASISCFMYTLCFFAINCFNSGMTCFKDGLCDTCRFPGELTSLEQQQHKH